MVQARQSTSGHLWHAKSRLFPYLLQVPTLLILGMIIVYPWLWSLYLSFTDWNPTLSPDASWVGLRNYLAILANPRFHNALLNTLKLLVGGLALEFTLGLALALVLNRKIRGRGLFRTVTLLSYVISPAVAGMIWRIFFHGEWGIINWVLSSLGLARVGWLSDPSVALIALLVVEVWRHLPYVALIALAALQGVPAEYHEAALVDGASPWQSLIHVTLPTIRPVLMVILLFRTMFILRTFDTPYVLFSGGGPAGSAEVLGIFLYESFKVSWDIGTGTAMSFILLGLTALVSFGFLLVGRQR